MSFFKKLFSQKQVSLKELKRALLEVDRDRHRKQLEIRKLENRKSNLIERLKNSRKEGNNLEVDYLWEDMRHLRLESAMVRREARILNLEGITLKRYIRGIERMEKLNNKEGVRSLIDRVRQSRLDDILAMQEINEREYLDELESVLQTAGIDMEIAEAAEEDPEKDAFLAEIDAINAAEQSGDADVALEREAQLRSRLEEAEGEAGT